MEQNAQSSQSSQSIRLYRENDPDIDVNMFNGLTWQQAKWRLFTIKSGCGKAWTWHYYYKCIDIAKKLFRQNQDFWSFFIENRPFNTYDITDLPSYWIVKQAQRLEKIGENKINRYYTAQTGLQSLLQYVNNFHSICAKLRKNHVLVLFKILYRNKLVKDLSDLTDKIVYNTKNFTIRQQVNYYRLILKCIANNIKISNLPYWLYVALGNVYDLSHLLIKRNVEIIAHGTLTKYHKCDSHVRHTPNINEMNSSYIDYMIRKNPNIVTNIEHENIPINTFIWLWDNHPQYIPKIKFTTLSGYYDCMVALFRERTRAIMYYSHINEAIIDTIEKHYRRMLIYQLYK